MFTPAFTRLTIYRGCITLAYQMESGIAANLLGLVPSILFGGSMTLVIVGFAWLLAPQLRALHMRDLHRAIS